MAALLPDGDDKEMIFRIQNNLFNVCTNLATDQEQTPLYPSAHLPEGAIASLEQEVDAIMKMLSVINASKLFMKQWKRRPTKTKRSMTSG